MSVGEFHGKPISRAALCMITCSEIALIPKDKIPQWSNTCIDSADDLLRVYVTLANDPIALIVDHSLTDAE